MGKADLHIHSIYSYDATSTVRAVLKQAADVGLNVIAVTDHDEIRGSLEARTRAKIRHRIHPSRRGQHKRWASSRVVRENTPAGRAYACRHIDMYRQTGRIGHCSASI